MIKTTKIAPGYYRGVYRGIEFFISKVKELPTSEIAWYWQINDGPVDDWHGSKSIAIKAVKSYIDEHVN